MKKMTLLALLGLALCFSSCRQVLHHVIDDMVDHAIDEVLHEDGPAPDRDGDAQKAGGPSIQAADPAGFKSHFGPCRDGCGCRAAR